MKRHTDEIKDLRGMRLQVFFCVSFFARDSRDEREEREEQESRSSRVAPVAHV